MNGVIKVENLGKKYIIGHQKQRYDDSLRDAMTHTARGIWQRVRHPLSPNRESVDLEELWALKDIDFEVQQGERLGIIGRNGAGKSTLLKILSRITEPTTGKVRIKGRVSSLLEVGTGFHPELTGRENIFLNGAILGMTRQEVKRKFDEIIAFAELEKFLDTPVKRYSSGMYVRLAFAVAAHLEPEILIVDEVLAVGDAQFQKKCLGKMEDVAKEGRTVLFVSHNMGAISNLCESCILLSAGNIEKQGQTRQVVDFYLEIACSTDDITLDMRTERKGCGPVRIVDFSIHRNLNQNSVSELFVYDPMYLRLTLESPRKIPSWVGVAVTDIFGCRLAYFGNRLLGLPPLTVDGRTEIIIHIPKMMLLEGNYALDTFITDASHMVLSDAVERAATFSVVPKDIYGSGFPITSYFGVVHMPYEWNIPGGKAEV